jgi:hypothetical protein
MDLTEREAVSALEEYVKYKDRLVLSTQSCILHMNFLAAEIPPIPISKTSICSASGTSFTAVRLRHM